MVQLIDQIRKLEESRQKIRAEMKNAPPEVSREELQGVQAKIVAALQPYPEARAAVLAAIGS